MPTAAFTAISPFEQILRCEYPISLLGKIKITRFQGNLFFHLYEPYSSIKVKLFW